MTDVQRDRIENELKAEGYTVTRSHGVSQVAIRENPDPLHLRVFEAEGEAEGDLLVCYQGQAIIPAGDLPSLARALEMVGAGNAEGADPGEEQYPGDPAEYATAETAQGGGA